MSSPSRTASASVVNVSKVGYITVDTPDLDRQINYYTKVLDFILVEKTATQAFLTTSFDHHAVVLNKSDVPVGRAGVGYELWEDLTFAHKRLTDQGYDVERRSDMAPSTPDVLVVSEPVTGVPLHLYDAQSTSEVIGYTPLRPTKLGHIAAYTSDLVALQAFYQDLLGFRWSDTVGDFFVFLRCNTDHHAANFVNSHKYSGLHHVAYEMRDLGHLQTMLDHLAKHNYQLNWGPGRHGAGHNIFTYHFDPDGNMIELFTQLDMIVDESKGYFEPRPWHNDFPQYPKTWEVDLIAVNSWGPINPERLDH